MINGAAEPEIMADQKLISEHITKYYEQFGGLNITLGSMS